MLQMNCVVVKSIMHFTLSTSAGIASVTTATYIYLLYGYMENRKEKSGCL
jgi:hypothetical protein